MHLQWRLTNRLNFVSVWPAGVMSVASVFINKAIFHVYKFNYPYTLVLGQTIFTLLLLSLMRNLGVIRLAPFQIFVFRRVGIQFRKAILKLWTNSHMFLRSHECHVASAIEVQPVAWIVLHTLMHYPARSYTSECLY